MSTRSSTLGIRLIALLAVTAKLCVADESFDKLFGAGNYGEAIKYADEKIPIGERDAVIWAKLGIAHEGQEMIEKALACYMVAIRNDAKNYEAHLGAARINNNLGQHDIGIETAKKALAIKTTGEASWEYARACLALKSPETKAALEKVIETDKSNAIANKELGNIYYKDKNFEKALPLLKNAYSSQTDGETAFKLAVAYHKQQKLDSAAHYYKEATRDKKFENHEAGLELSRIFYKLEKFAAAAEEFGKMDPSRLNADDFYKFGHSLSKAGVSKDSVASVLEIAVTKFGTSVSREALLAREKVAKSKLEKKEFQNALDLFLVISKADPQGKIVQDLTFLIAEAYDGLGDRGKAIPMLEKEISVDKNNVEAYAQLADLYTKEKMGDKAQQVYEKLLSLQPNNPKVYRSLGEYSLKTRKYEDALKYFQKSFTLEQNADAAQGMMKSAWELKKFDLARDAAESALHKDSTLKEPQFILAKIHLNDKNYTAAQMILEMLVKGEKSNKEIWIQLATCYEQTKNSAKLAEVDKTLMALDKRDVPSRQRYAVFAQTSNDYKAAFETYKDLAVLTPKEAAVFKNLHTISMKLGYKDDAITYLGKYLKLMPKDAVAYKDLGNLRFEKRDSSGALNAYREALQIDPQVKGFYKSYVELVMAQKPPKKPVPKGQKSLNEQIFEALSAAVAANEADEKIYTTLAEIYQARKNFAAAIDMYQKALQVNPKNNSNLSALASCQQKAGKIEDAIITYEQVTTLNPSSTNELKVLGDLYSKNGKKDQAVSSYKKYLEKASDSKIATVVGEHEYEKKNYKEAIKYYEKVTGNQSKDPVYLLHFGTAAYQENDLKKASELFKVLTTANPKDPEPFKTLHEIAKKEKNQELAAEYLNKYTILKPADTPMLLVLGNLYYDLKNSDGALEAYNAVFKADPTTKGLYKRYLELVNKKGSAEEKIRALNGAINASEADLYTYTQLGDLYKQSGDFAKAMPCYEKASQLDTKNSAVLTSLAECQVKTESVSAAILTYEQAIAMNPQANSEFKVLGDLYKRDKKTESAIKNYKKYLEKNSDNNLSKEVGEFAYSQKNYAEAIKYLGMVSGPDAENPALLKMYADAYFQNKDDAKAYEIYKKLGEKSATDADVIQKLYQIAAKAGKNEEFLLYLKKFAALRPSDVQAQRTLGDKLYEKKDSSGALSAYKAVLKADPQAKGFYKRYAELVMGSAAKDEEIVAALTAGIAVGEADINMYQRLASIYSKQGNHAKAVQMYEKASQLDTKNIALISSLGEAQAKSGNVTSAIMTYEQAVAMNPQANKEFKILGDLYKKDKKTESAIKNYKKYLEKNSDNDLAKEIGEFAYSQKNYAETIKYLGMVSGADAEKAALLKMYADAYYQNKDEAKAYEIFKKLGLKTATDADIFQKLYEIAGKVGSKEDVLVYLKKYTSLRPSDVQAQRTLGDKLYDNKDSAGALAAYQAVLKADPKAKGFYKKYAELVMGSAAKDEEIVAVLTAGIAVGEADVGMYQRLASIYSKQGNHAKAVQMYEKASQLDTKNIALISSLGEAQAKSGNVSSAIMTYEQVVAMNPQANKEYKILGDLYKKDKKTESSVKNYKKYLEKNSDNDLAKEIGEFAYSQKNYAEAIKYLGMVSGADAEKPALLKMYADAYSQNKDDAKAYEIYKKLGEKSATDAEVIQNLYQIAAKTGKNEEFLLYLKKYTALKPSDVQAQRTLGDKLYEKKDNAGALSAYKAVLKADPQAKGFYKRYAELVMGSAAKDEEIVVVLTAGITAGEADIGMYERLASIYSKQGNHAKAVQMYEKASQLDTKNIGLISSLGEAQAKSGNVTSAIMTFEQVVAMNPQANKEFKILGDLYKKDKKTESAIKNYKKYLEKNSDNDLSKEIGEFAYSQKNYAEVIKYLGMVKGADAESAAFLKMYADAYYQSKDDAKAYEIYKKLGEKTPSDAEIFKNLYEIAARTGKNDESLLNLKKFTALRPSDVQAQRTLGDKLYEKKDSAGALSAYKAVLKADPQAKGFYKRYAELVMGSAAKDEEIVVVLTAGIAAGEADIGMYERLASIYSKQGNHAKAVQMYEKASQIDAKNIGLLSSLAESQAKNGDIGGAILTYEQAIAMNPQAGKEYRVLGDLYKKNKKIESAIKNYKKYLEKNKDNSLAKEIGEYALQQKNYPEAIKYLGMVDGNDASNPEFLKLFGEASYQAKDEFRAFQIYKQLGEKTPNDAEVFERLYLIAEKAGTKDEVLVYLKKYTALRPTDSKALRLLGDMLYARKDNDGAQGVYRAILKADPNAKGFYKKYAELVMSSGAKDEEITAVLNGCIAAGEADVAIFERLASIYSKQGNHAKAVQMYEKASQLDAKNVGLLNALAESQAKSGNVSGAILTYEQAIAMNPQASKEYKVLGDLYKRDKKDESAIKNYKKYLEKNAGSDLANEIGEHAFKQKNYAEAIKYFGMVSGKEAGDPSLLKQYGEACFQVKDNQKAYQIYKQLAEKTPADADVMIKLNDIAGKIGSKDEALSYLKKYTALKPTDAERQKELGNILYDRKDASGAIAAYNAVLKANPSAKGFYKKYAELIMQNGKDPEVISALNGAISAGEADVEMYVRLGSTYHNQGNFPKAVQMYESASQLDPKNGSLLVKLAEAQAKSGNSSAAVLTYEQAVAMNPNADNEYKALGDLYMQQKKTDAAIKSYKKYLEKSQDNGIAKLIGENALSNKNYSEAVKYLGMVGGSDASDKTHLMKFAMACYYAKDEFRAYQLFKQLSNIAPQDPVVYEKLYEISNRTGTKEEVLIYLKKYAELKPSDAKAQISLGNMLFEKKDDAGALAAFRSALKADSTIKGFYKRYAQLVIQSGTDAERVVAIDGAIAQGDADASMFKTLADIYNKQNLLDKAISMYEKAAQIDTKNPQLLTSLAECQLKKGAVSEAILSFEQAVAINPRADKEYKQLGDLYLKQKKAESAIRYYKKYLDKNPTDDKVALIVGEEAYKAKKYQDAVKFLGMVNTAESKKASFLNMYGEASFEVKDYPRALTIYKDLSLQTPKNADVFKRLFEINTKSGASDEALNNLKKYTGLKPADAEAQKDLGDALYERKEFTGSFIAYQNALKYNPQIKGFYKKYIELVMKYGKSQDKVPALQGAISAGEADANIYGRLGQVYSDAKNYNKALEMFEKASQLEPKNAEILSSLADCQVNKGDLKGAALTYEQALAMNPNAIIEYKQLGDLYMQQKKTEAAMASYKKYLNKAPTDYAIAKMVAKNLYASKDFISAYKYYGLVKNDETPQYLIEYGLSAISAKENRVAITVLEKLRSIKGSFPSKDVAYKSLAEAYEKSGDQKKAAEVLNEYVKIPGVKDPDASYKRAAVYESINPAEAVSMYKQNLIAFPKDYRNYLKLGIYYSRQKSGEQNAIKYLEKVATLSDTIPRVWIELGSLYLRIKRDQDMLRAYRKYLEVAPEDAEAIGKIGEILLSRKMVDDAMVFLEMANSLKENDPKLMTLLARGYIVTKRRKEGADLLEKVVRITKGKVDDDLRVVLVDVYMETNQYDKAAEELKALMIVNKDTEVMVKYALVLFELGKTNDALNTIMAVKTREPENLDALMLIGRIKTAQKKYDDAIETYKEVLYIDQNYSPALCERADVYLLQGKQQWAQTFYDRALKSDPKNAQVHLGLARLAKQQKDYAGYSDHLEKARKLDPQNKEIQEELRSVRR